MEAMAELGIPEPPQEPTDPFDLARFIAARILAGSISPEEGAWEIGLRVWSRHGLNGLGVFLGLASASEDYPDDREYYDQLIIREARKLVGEEVTPPASS